MRPTLYVTDIPDNLEVVGEVVPALNGAIGLRSLKRILPLRCPSPPCHDGELHIYDGDGDEWRIVSKEDDPLCEGRGWLYPDPPYWFMEDSSDWHWMTYCETTWRAMGIWGVNDGE